MLIQQSEILDAIEINGGCSIDHLLFVFSKTAPCDILLFCHSIAKMINDKVIYKDGERIMKSSHQPVITDENGEQYALASYIAKERGLSVNTIYEKAKNKKVPFKKQNGLNYYSVNGLNSKNKNQMNLPLEKPKQSCKFQITIACNDDSIVKKLLSEDFPFLEMTIKKVK